MTSSHSGPVLAYPFDLNTSFGGFLGEKSFWAKTQESCSLNNNLVYTQQGFLAYIGNEQGFQPNNTIHCLFYKGPESNQS